MERLLFSYHDTCGVSDDRIAAYQSRLKPEMERVAAAWGVGYDSPYASLSLPADQDNRDRVHMLARRCKRFAPAALVVIGIGGSNLGAQAVWQALAAAGKVSDVPLYWADTVDALAMQMLIARIKAYADAGELVMLVIISKSGKTTETIANAQILINVLELSTGALLGDECVVITDQGSALFELAHEKNYACLMLPDQVGGRYSIFSAAGLFPLAMTDIDIDELCAGAESVKAYCTSTDIHQNLPALSAAILSELYTNGMRVHDLFLFDTALHGMAQWYRQLMGESLGKLCNRAGEKIEAGIIPTVSVGSTDLHSVGQLYLSGPRIMSTLFVSVADRPRVMVPDRDGFANLVPHLAEKSLAQIMDAIQHGTERAYQHEGRPFASLRIPTLSAWHCGQLMQYAMVQMMYLGFLLDVNPFDQPQVELYKKETREILAHE